MSSCQLHGAMHLQCSSKRLRPDLSSHIVHLSLVVPTLECRPYDLDDAMHRRIQLAFEFRLVLPTCKHGVTAHSVISFAQRPWLLLPSAMALMTLKQHTTLVNHLQCMGTTRVQLQECKHHDSLQEQVIW